MWWRGPEFLEIHPFFPNQPKLDDLEKDGKKSVQKEYKTKQIHVFATISFVEPNRLDQLVEKSSKLDKLLRIAVLVFRFLLNSARNLRWWKKDDDDNIIGFGNQNWVQKQEGLFKSIISALYQVDTSSLIRRKVRLIAINEDIELKDFHQHELSVAKRALITLAQLKVYQNEFGALLTNEELHKSSPLLKLNPIYHQGTLIVGGRFKANEEIPFSIRHPVILPKGATISQRIIMDTHDALGHAGPSQVLYQLRQATWPIGASEL